MHKSYHFLDVPECEKGWDTLTEAQNKKILTQKLKLLKLIKIVK